MNKLLRVATMLVLGLLCGAALAQGGGQGGQGAGGGTVTAASMAAALASQTGCATAGNVWIPSSNTCTTAAGVPYPAAGIAVSSGSAWSLPLVAPTSALVGLTDTQSLTNKTLNGVTPATMGFLDATSSIQTQLTGKAPSVLPTIYVDNVGGLDTNPGTQALPFATLAKINGLVLAAGQTVAFKSGDEWHELLTVAQSGTTTLPILYTSYGGGAQPILSAADFYPTGWTQGTGVAAQETCTGTCLFASGFETGGTTFTDWTGGVTNNTNSTVTQSAVQHNSGTYAMLLNTTDGNDGRAFATSPTFTAMASGNRYGFRLYINPQANAVKASNSIYFWNFFAGATNDMGCQLYTNASAAITQLSCYDFTDSVYVIPATTITISNGTWTSIEIDVTASATVGGGSLYMNAAASPTVTTTGLNTSGLIGLNHYNVGNNSFGALQAGGSIYFDDVRTGTATPLGAVSLAGVQASAWYHSQATDPKLINFSGQAGTPATALSGVNGPNKFFWDGSANLYVYSLVNPAKIVEVPQRSSAVTSAGVANIAFNNLEFRGAQTDDVFCGPTSACPNWSFIGNTFNDGYASELFMQTNSGAANSGPYAVNNVFKGGGASGIGMTNSASTTSYIVGNQFFDLCKVYNASFTDNTYCDAVKSFSQAGTDGGGSYWGYNVAHDIGIGQTQNYGGGFHPDTVVGTMVEHNLAQNTNGAGFQLEKGSGSTLQYNQAINAGTGQFLSGVQVRAGDGLSVSNMLVQYNTASGGYWPCNMQLQQNGAAVTATNVTWLNNICVNSSSGTQFYLDTGFNGSGNTYTGTGLGVASTYMLNAAGTFYATYASLPAPITGSIAGDPLFVSPATMNYSLQASSPAIGIGAIPAFRPILQSGGGAGISIATANGISGTSSGGPNPTLTLAVSGPITPTSVTTQGTQNGALTATYSGVAATAPTTNQFQISPAVAITTPWTLSTAGAPATGLFYGVNTSGVEQQSFLGLPSCSGASNALTFNSGTTAFGCNTIAGAANYWTSTKFSGVGPTSFTPTHTLDVNDTTATTGSTNLTITPGAGQSGDLFDVSTFLKVTQFGALQASGPFSVYGGNTVYGLGVPATLADTQSILTGRTAALGSAGSPIVLAATRAFGSNLSQVYHVSCYMNTSVAATGTVSLFLTWTDNVGAKTSAAVTMNTASLATGFASVGSYPIEATAIGNVSTNIGYYTTVTGTGFTYGVTCTALGID